MALEPDFHFKPEVELYDLKSGPCRRGQPGPRPPGRGGRFARCAWMRISPNAPRSPVALTRSRFSLTGTGKRGMARSASSQEAYDTLHIGDPEAGRRLQAGLASKEAPEKARGGRRPAQEDGDIAGRQNWRRNRRKRPSRPKPPKRPRKRKKLRRPGRLRRQSKQGRQRKPERSRNLRELRGPRDREGIAGVRVLLA